MSRVTLYKEIKKAISSIKEVKYVGLFNSQYTQSGKHDHTNYPAVYIQFNFSDYANEAGMGIQRYNCTVTTHLVFESYKIDAIEVLEMNEKIYLEMQQLSTPPDEKTAFGKLLRNGERMSADHDVLQIHETDYSTLIRDSIADIRIRKTLSLTTTITPTVVDEITI